MNNTEIINKCAALKSYWSQRNTLFQEWYSLITLTDDLKQTDMESFTSNDPRTFYNQALHILTAQPIIHRIASDGLSPQEVGATSLLERVFQNIWRRISHSYHLRGNQGFTKRLVGLMLVTGWYSVFSILDSERVIAEVWHPAEVYPEYADWGLAKCAHIYTISSEQARAKAKANGWQLAPNLGRTITVFDYWEQDFIGSPVYNAVVYGTELVKPLGEEPFSFIPVFVSPVGGLPDTGIISVGDTWKGHIGEGIVATNSTVYKNYNRQLTFMQQLLRDTAQPRWFERSRSVEPILKPENLYRRGAIFKLSPEDEIGIVQTPSIPVELRTLLFDIQNMIQRGSTSWISLGNVQQQVSSFLMSRIAETTYQSLAPYKDAIEQFFSDIDLFWFSQMKQYRYRPYGLKLPPGLPSNFIVETKLPISIPGDIISRATVARMLAPNFQLSASTVMDMMFPEIENPLDEEARIRADSVSKHPVNVLVLLIDSLEQQSVEFIKAGQTTTAELFQTAAKSLRATLAGAEAGQEQPLPPTVRPSRELAPPEAEQPVAEEVPEGLM